MTTKDWAAKEKPYALLIGHDPRLQASDTIAEFALFADYFFKPISSQVSEKKKYGLAKSVFEQITEITNGKVKPENIHVTNLCNKALPHAPRGLTVLIPENEAHEGVKHLQDVLKANPSIKFIFPMSLQVNYWLQELGFYSADKKFLTETKPSDRGLENTPPYFKPKKTRTFLQVCGRIFETNADAKRVVIPILHAKNYPLKGRFAAYNDCYESIKDYFRKL